MFSGASYQNLSVATSGTNAVLVGTTMPVAGNLSIAAGCTLNLGGSVVTGTVTGTTTLASAAVLTDSTVGVKTLTCTGQITSSGTFIMSGGNLGHILNINSAAANTIGTLTPGTGSFVVYGGGAQSVISLPYQNLTIGGTTNTIKTATSIALSVAGNLVVNAGCTLALAGTTPSLSVTGTTTVNASGTANTTLGVIDLGTTASSATFTGTATFGGKLSCNTTGIKTITINGDVSVTATNGFIDISGGNLAHSLTLNGRSNTLGTAANFTPGTGSTVTYSAAGTQAGITTVSYNNLVIGGGTGVKTFTGATLTVAGTCSVGTGATLSLGTTAQTTSIGGSCTLVGTLDMLGTAAKAVTITGDLIGGTSGVITMSGIAGNALTLNGTNNALTTLTTLSGNTVTYGASGNQSVFTSPNYQTVNISGSGIKTLGGSPGIAGTLTVASGCTLAVGANTLSLAGSALGSGTISGTSGSNLTFTGGTTTSFQTAVSGIQTLTVNKTSGFAVNTTQDISITTLTLSSGVITTGSNKIILPAGSTLPAGSSGSYVYGNVKYTVNGSGTNTLTFPLGSASTGKYRPFTLTGVAQSATTSYTASAPGTSGSALSTNFASPPVSVAADNYYSFEASTPANVTAIASVSLLYAPDANITTVSNTTLSQLTGGAWADRGASGTTTITSGSTISTADNPYVFALGAKTPNIIYVRTDGDDSQLGYSNTINNTLGAKKTINAAINAVVAGGTVIVASGTYTENVIIGKDVNLSGPTSGSALATSFTFGNVAQILVTSTSNVSLSGGSPANTITGIAQGSTTTHGLLTGERVIYQQLAGSITGLTNLTAYYVINTGTNTFQLATSYANALLGTAVSLSASSSGSGPLQSGTVFAHAFYRAPAVSGNIYGTTVNVPANGPLSTAVVLAAASGTVSVAAGHYYQQVTISQALTVSGAGKYSTVIDGSFGANSGSLVGITPAANGITLQNLQVKAWQTGIAPTALTSWNSLYLTNVAVSNNGQYGFNASGPSSNSSLSVSTISGSNLDSNGVTGSNGRAFYFSGSSSVLTDFTVQNSTLNNNQYAAIDLLSASTFSNILIDNNTINNNGDMGIDILLSSVSGNVVVSNNSINLGFYNSSATVAQHTGIEIKNAAGNGNSSGAGCVAVLKNTVTQTDLSVNDSRDYAGIVIESAGTNPSRVVVANNLVSGIKRAAAGCASNLTLLGDGFGIVVGGSGNLIQYNIVTGCNVGIQAQAGNNGANVNCTAQTVSQDYFDRDQSSAYSGTTTSYSYIRYNSITVNNIGFRSVNNKGTSVALVDVSANWWGDASGPANATYNSSGAGQPLAITTSFTSGTAAKVAFSPWLKADPDDSPAGAIGVQITSAKTYVAGGTQTAQTGGSTAITNLSLVPNFISSVYQDVVELASDYPATENVSITAASVFSLKGNSKTLGGLTLNNALAKITLTGPFSISGTTTLTNGIISSAGLNFITFNSGAVVTTASVAGFIDGPVAALNATTSAATLNFPLGVTGTGPRYVALNLTQTASTSTTYSASLTNSPASTLAGYSTASGINVSSTRYYTVSQSPATGLSSATLKLAIGSDEPVTNATYIDIAGDAGTTVWSDLGHTASSLSSVTAAFTTFGNFALANVSPGVNLPAPIYADPAGNDGNNGLSPATAKKTITAAVALVSTNGRLYLASGNYNTEPAAVTLSVPIAISVIPSVLGGAVTGSATGFDLIMGNNVTLASPLPASADVAANTVLLSNNQNLVSDAILLCKSGGTVTLPGLGAGSPFSENIVINKSITLNGANAGTVGTSGSRATETVLQRSSTDVTDGNIITVTASNVTISGFTLNGNSSAARGIATGSDALSWPYSVSNLTISDNIIDAVALQGIYLYGPVATATSGNTIVDNYIKNIATPPTNPGYTILGTSRSYVGRGILLRDNNYANITNNTLENIYNCIYTSNFNLTGTATISGNTLKPVGQINNNVGAAYYGYGMLNIDHGTNSSFTVSNNTVVNYNTQTAAANPGTYTNTGSVFMVGFTAANATGTAHLYYNNNSVDNGGIFNYFNVAAPTGYGYYMYNCTSTDTVTVDGGNIGFNQNVGTGFQIVNQFPTSASTHVTAGSSFYKIKNLNIKNAEYFVHSTDNDAANITIKVSGCSFTNGTSDAKQTDAGGIICDMFDNIRNTSLSVDNCTLTSVQGRGIYVLDPITTSITRNTITACGNLAVSATGSAAAANIGYAVMIRVKNNNCNNVYIANNTVTACTTSNAAILFQVSTGGANGTVTIQNSGVVMYNNNLGGNSPRNVISLSGVLGVTPIEASGNYWGDTTEAAVATTASAASTIDFSGWLHGGTKNTVAKDNDLTTPGFQGRFDTLFVTAKATSATITPTGVTGRFNDGLNLLNDGGRLVLTGTTAFTGTNAGTVTKNATIHQGTFTGGFPGLDLTISAPGKTLTIDSTLQLSACTFTNGYIAVPGVTSGAVSKASGTKLTLLSAATNGVIGGSATSYVNGTLSMQTPSVSSGTLVFPIGTSASYRPLSFAYSHSDASINTYSASITDAAISPTHTNASGTTATTFRYFTLNRVGSNTFNSGSPTISYSNTGASDDQVTDPANLTMVTDNGTTTWTNIGGTGSATSTGTITAAVPLTTFATTNTFNFAVANVTGGTNFGAVATDTYVDPSGNDVTGNGTLGNPYATVTKAISVTSAGGTVHLATGTWASVTLSKSIIFSGTGSSVISNLVINSTGDVSNSSSGVTFTAVTVNSGVDLNKAIRLAGTGAVITMNNGGVYPGTVTVSRDLHFGWTGSAPTISTITQTAGTLTLDNNLTVSNSLNLQGGTLNIGNRTLTLSNQLTNSGGVITSGGSGSIIINGSGTLTGSLIMDQSNPGTTNALSGLTIARSAGVVQLGSALVINGSLTTTLGVLDVNGQSLTLNGTASVASGSGIRINLSSDLTINGSSNFGTLGFDITRPGATNKIRNLTLNWGSSSGALTLSSNLTVAGTLTINNGGTLGIGTNNTLTLKGTVAGTGKITGSGSSNLTIDSTGSFGSLPMDLTTPGITNALNNFTVSRGASSTLSLGTDLVVGGSFSLTTTALSLNGNKLTLNGSVSQSGSTALITGSASSSMAIGGTGSSGTLKFDQTTPGTTNALASLTVAKGTNGSVTLGNNLVVGAAGVGALTITSGALSIGSNTLTIAGTYSASSGFIRGSSTSNLNVTGTAVTGLTFDQSNPSSTGLIATLTQAGGITTLGSNLVVGTDLNLGGTFKINGFGLTLNGTQSGSGALAGSSASSLTIGGTGAFTLTPDNGPSGNPQFGTLTVSRTGGTVTLADDIQIGSTSTTSGGLILQSGSAIDFSGHEVDFFGPITYNGGTISANSSTTVTAGTGTDGAVLTLASPSTIGNLTINPGSGKTFTLGSDLVSAGICSLTSGSIAVAANTFTVDSIVTGTGKITGSATSNLAFTGPVRIGLPIDQSNDGITNRFNNFSVANSADTVNLSSKLVIGGNMALTGSLGLHGQNLVLNGTASGTGTLKGSIASVLTIGGTGSMGSFGFAQDAYPANRALASLSMNRTSTGTATLTGDMSVAGNITTTNGELTTTGTITISPTSTVIESNATGSRVVGAIQTTRDLTNINTYYNSGMGLTVNATGVALGNGTVITRVTLPVGSPSLASDPGFAGNSVLRYYDLSPGDPTGNKAAHITFTYLDVEANGVTNPSRLYRAALPFNASAPGWTRYQGTPTGSGFYNFYAVPSFSRITLGDDVNPLPVSLLNFNADKKGTTVQLNWATASERNSDFFAIERSIDAVNFTQLGRVAAAGNSDSKIEYAYTDKLSAFTSGILYYRLRQTDKDGSVKYSVIQAVNTDADPAASLVADFYPNPAQSELYVRLADNEEATMTVFDLVGKIAATYTLNVNTNNKPLDVSLLRSGVYNVLITNGTYRVSKKLTIEQ